MAIGLKGELTASFSGAAYDGRQADLNAAADLNAKLESTFPAPYGG